MKKLKLNPNIYLRYEPNFDSGKLIIYFIDSKELYELTPPYYYFLKMLEKNSLSEFYDMISYFPTNLSKDVKTIKNNLLKLGVLYE